MRNCVDLADALSHTEEGGEDAAEENKKMAKTEPTPEDVAREFLQEGAEPRLVRADIDRNIAECEAESSYYGADYWREVLDVFNALTRGN